ncbi:2OG-Fe(II) oxygenase [Phenylobacterium soli]|uniref:2OG-Fe(II) oxygenase n=1 Tax=Phenylobacterium soli TaxID=2170551 RepID=A0A328ARP2_9CAUL|nr:2OG-Fe(II) oxygenase [Phenylobacterium soli]RAK55608.1 2OG-Fe(II) oxygenase [Phenylobacterium soli]
MPFLSGEAAPWFRAPTLSSPEFLFDTAAGRYVLLLFPPSDGAPKAEALQQLMIHRALLDDVRVSAFVVLREPERVKGAADARGLRWFRDEDGAVSRLYGALDAEGRERPFWLVLDPTLRVMWEAPAEAGDDVFRRLWSLPPPAEHAGLSVPAPVLIAPRVFEPELCARLIRMVETQGSTFSGVMRDQGEVTVAVMDELKKRRDLLIEDPALQAEIRDRFERRLFPLVQRAFGFEVTEVERYLVTCYDAADGGVFHAHRDNFTFQTAHRKFACSILLNDDFEGGDLRFPEFGAQPYRPPAGAAAVFACGLLHEVSRVTSGRRYAFVPFFFDAEGRKVREAYAERIRAQQAT